MKTDLVHPVATAEFSNYAGILSAALSQHHLSVFETAQLEFHHCTRDRDQDHPHGKEMQKGKMTVW